MICPDGHDSLATDYCDVCGAPLAVVAAPTVAAAILACPACGSPASGRFCEVCGFDSALPAPESSTPRGELAELSSVARESLSPPTGTGQGGAESSAAQSRVDPSSLASREPIEPSETVVAQPSPVQHWVATIFADREFYDRVLARKGPDADRVEFPTFYPQRRITLGEGQALIGKRSVSQGLTPEIDLGIPPADAGVSRAHATLLVTGERLTVTDLGSTNGTSLNGSEELIPARTAVPLSDGDRIHLGGWTTIVVSRDSAAPLL
ncbi:FHA domain-containing protein [Nocardia panacis]|uniref:FHA domain-containing protein n=1 Tax=Nocardia panacis TaxID=2340916 RepID=A0A3A4KDA0_9NOCA|nr:FHA domain-containing protein [Nocardia panacis]RJO78413.1 FHA domain-containing protein [Nocardia panacis]